MLSKKKLISYGAEKLASAILVLVKKNPSNRAELKQFFSCSAPDPVKSRKMIPIIEKKIKSLEIFEGIYYKNYSFDNKLIASRIDEVRTMIVEAVLPVSPEEAVTLLTDLLDIHETVVERSLDEDGVVIGAFSAACTDLGKAYKLTTYSLSDAVDLVYNYHMTDGYLVYYDVIKDFSEALGSNGINELQQRLVNCESENSLRQVRDGLRNIADVVDDVDAYIKTFSFKTKEKPRGKECLMIARRLIKHNRGTDAMRWLDCAKGEPCIEREKRPLKIQALDLCGDHEAAQAERLNWFEDTLDHEVYRGIVENADADFIETFKKTAIEKALHCDYEYVASDLLKEINDPKLLGKLVRQEIDNLDGKGRAMDTLRRIAKALQRKDPLAATLLYRETVECALCGPDNYYFSQDLKACHNLSSKIKDWEMFETHQEFFERISLRYAYKTSLWQKYNVALRKPNRKKAKLAIDE